MLPFVRLPPPFCVGQVHGLGERTVWDRVRRVSSPLAEAGLHFFPTRGAGKTRASDPVWCLESKAENPVMISQGL